MSEDQEQEETPPSEGSLSQTDGPGSGDASGEHRIIDHLAAADALEKQAKEKKANADQFLRRGILFASAAIIGLIFVVVGGEDVVRKVLAKLSPNAIEEQAQYDAREATLAAEKYNVINNKLSEITRDLSMREQSEKQMADLREALKRNGIDKISNLDALQSIRRDNDAILQTIRSFKDEIDRLMPSLNRMREDLPRLNEEIAVATSTLLETENRLKSLTLQIQREKDIAEAEKQTRIRAVQSEIKATEKELNFAIGKRNSLTEQIVKMPPRIVVKKEELDQLIVLIARKNEMLDLLKEQLSQAQARASTSLDQQSELNAAQRQFDTKRADRGVLLTRRDALKRESDGFQDAINTLRQDLSEAEKKRLQIEQDLDKQKRLQVTLEDEEKTLQSALQKITSVVSTPLSDLNFAHADQTARLDEAKLAWNNAEVRAKDSQRAALEASQSGSLQTLLTRGGAIAGAVGILILVVQIFVNSTRYHIRLADLYQAQANAFRASNGNLETAKILLQNLSPLSVDFGKTPTSLYEKAMDTVRDVAKSKSP